MEFLKINENLSEFSKQLTLLQEYITLKFGLDFEDFCRKRTRESEQFSSQASFSKEISLISPTEEAVIQVKTEDDFFDEMDVGSEDQDFGDVEAPEVISEPYKDAREPVRRARRHRKLRKTDTSDGSRSGNEERDINNTNTDQDTIEISESNQGKPILLKSGYAYRFHKFGTEKRIWVCQRSRPEKCKARLYTTMSLQNPTVQEEMGIHNHQPNLIACELRKVRTLIRTAAKVTSDLPASIIAQSIGEISAAAQIALPLKQNIERTIRSIRAKGAGSFGGANTLLQGHTVQ